MKVRWLCDVVVKRCRREVWVFIRRSVEREVVDGRGGAAWSSLAEVLMGDARIAVTWWLEGRGGVWVRAQKGYATGEDVVGQFYLGSCFFRCQGR